MTSSGRKPTFLLRVINQKMPPVITSKIEEIAQRVARSEGIEIVEVEVKGGGKYQLVRISIDKPAGVSHADCEFISQQVGTILDVEDVVPGHYTLEVSSPGVERKLLKPGDYERFRGKKAKVTLREPLENQVYWEGVLGGCDGAIVSLEANGRQLHFPFEQVKKAHLKFEW
jgi:ribosome maturation factor RimP